MEDRLRLRIVESDFVPDDLERIKIAVGAGIERCIEQPFTRVQIRCRRTSLHVCSSVLPASKFGAAVNRRYAGSPSSESLAKRLLAADWSLKICAARSFSVSSVFPFVAEALRR